MRNAKMIAVVLALGVGAFAVNGAELRISSVDAECGSLARIAFRAEAAGRVANLRFDLEIEGAELVGVHQASTTPKWIIRRVDDEGRTTIFMRGGPVENGEQLGQILVRVPPGDAGTIETRLSEIRLFGDGFGEAAPDVTARVDVDCASQPLVFESLSGSRGGPGARDGAAGRALLAGPRSIAIDDDGNIFVADAGNHAIRRIDARGVVITLAGRNGIAGWRDGWGADALFQSPRGIALTRDGSLVVADTETHTIRRVSKSGEVTTIAGKADEPGSVDGAAADARFCFPSAVAIASDGSIVVGDTGYLHSVIYGLAPCGHTIRRIDTQGQVSTIAGSSGVAGVAGGVSIASQDGRIS